MQWSITLWMWMWDIPFQMPLQHFPLFIVTPYPYHIAIAFTEFPINPTSLSLSLDPRHDMSSSGWNPSPLRRGGMKYIALPILFIPPQIDNIMTNTATQSLPHSLPLPLSCLILLECTKFNDEETSERSIPIKQWWCVQVNSPTLTPLAARKGYYASINDATALKLYPRDAIWTVRDGVVGVPVIRMPWGDNMGEEVVVGRMILADSGHSQTT